MSRRILLGAALVAALALNSASALAHGGEDHGAAAAPMPAPVVSTAGHGAESAVFQAVLVPSPKDGHTTLFLADGDTNRPIADATIEAEATGWQGSATPVQPGIYVLAWLPPPEGADVSLVISAAGTDDLLLVTGVRLPAKPGDSQPPAIAHWSHWAGGAGLGIAAMLAFILLSRRRKTATAAAVALLLAAGPAFAHGGEDHGAPPVPAAEPGALLTMPKATQFLLGIRTMRVEAKEAADTVRVVGRVIPDPAGYARVQPSQPARVLAEPDLPLPVPGQMVKRGQVLAILEPTLTAIEKGDRRAALARIDSELAIQEREVPRMEALKSAIPFRTLETARIRLDQLRRERAQIAGTALGRELVVAPVDGVVTDVHLVPGEVVTPDRVVVEIIDPARLRVEAVVHDVGLVPRITGATASTRQLPDQTFALTKLGISPRIDPVDQGAHAIFAVAPEQAPLLRVGMPVDVHLATGATRLRTAVPRDAIAESGGRQVVFVRKGPESFEARPVIIHQVVGPLAELHGIADGERIVTQGIEQMKAVK